jgi:hypothetical protein
VTDTDRDAHLPLRITPAQSDNLLTLARHLILQAEAIGAAGGLYFDPAHMIDFQPTPQTVTARTGGPLPPVAHGPLAGIPALPGEDWQGYAERAFGIRLLLPDPFALWLQSPLWRRTEPSARGAGLRIAHALDDGIPGDYLEIAMGQARTDDDHSGFVRDRLALPPDSLGDSLRPPIRDRSARTGAPSRAAIPLNAGNLRQRLIEAGIARPEDIAGLDPAAIAALERAIGPMPESYRQVLSLIGRRAGRLVDERELQIYADQLPGVNHGGHETRLLWDEDNGDPIPDTAIFIGARYGEAPWFILAEPRIDHARADSPVFHFDTDTGRVTQVATSVWEWLDDLIRDAEYAIAQGRPALHPRRAPALPPIPAAERRKTRLWLLGGLMLGAGLGLIPFLTWRP